VIGPRADISSGPEIDVVATVVVDRWRSTSCRLTCGRCIAPAASGRWPALTLLSRG